jgi:soluble lytic murein transglycosylase-like protein
VAGIALERSGGFACRRPGSCPADAGYGARYLRMQLDAFGGDLEKALAAYNAGPARVIEAGGIPAIRETRDYIASVMARLSAPSADR